MNTVGNYFRSLNILHAALCGGVAVCIGVLRFVRADNTPNGMAQVLLIIGVSIAAVCLVVSRVMLFKTVTPARQQSSLSHKLALFRTGFIMQMALLEGAAIINMVFWFIGGNSYNLGIALGLLFLMIFRRPTRMLLQGLAFSASEDGRVIYNDNEAY